ncbi:hypothetical protein AMATHDRAFT_54790 [Amanita thiersii Skay4041]|uniref:Dolichyl-diphosphooligosaccharide--protein glycosyltransferase subunit WBP1 n=1 Tax=Amanita thiersii Skay4041 TaxID=703135 RepID=A0A2A9NZN5_9AGAR|nr:hypothetical protein AMATHDRAFT_54790 [Amanita thiersii Skay4041]
MHILRKIAWLAISVLASVQARSSIGDNVLVVVEPNQQKEYSLFFENLRAQGFDLTFRAPKATKPLLLAYDVPSFSHVILFNLEAKNTVKDLAPQALIDILGHGVNILAVLPQKQSALSTLASEFSLILPPPNTPLISYFPTRDEPPTLIPVTVSNNHDILTTGMNPVWFSGTPHALGNNPLLVPILHAPPQSFAGEIGGSADVLVDAAEKGGEGLWAGSQLGLVTGFQALNNARITFIGGAELLSNRVAEKEISPGVKSGNAQFAKDIAAWTFQESLVFRIDKVEHHRLNATEPRDQYTTNDQIVFEAHISKFEPRTSEWTAYSGFQDLQLEFTMLDPHIRTALLPVLGSPGKYSVTFRAPDRHGVFKFVINYKRRGFTYLQSSTTVAVVPPRHDGYPRFLSAAWPYYIGAMSTSIGFLLFSALWLAGDIRPEKRSKGQKTE